MNAYFSSLAFYSGIMAVAVFLGGMVPLFFSWSRRQLPVVLSLSAGIMLGSAFFHLIPEAYAVTGKSVGIWILAGFLFLFLIERFITVHICETLECEVHQLGISAFIGIAIHTLINGLALGSGLLIPGLGLAVFLGVMAHKTPEMFSLTSVLLNSGTRKRTIILVNAIIWTLIPLGGALAYLLLKPNDEIWIGRAVGFAAGTFLHLSLSDLIPEAHKHGIPRTWTILALLVGVGLMAVLGRSLHIG